MTTEDTLVRGTHVYCAIYESGKLMRLVDLTENIEIPTDTDTFRKLYNGNRNGRFQTVLPRPSQDVRKMKRALESQHIGGML